MFYTLCSWSDLGVGKELKKEKEMCPRLTTTTFSSRSCIINHLRFSPQIVMESHQEREEMKKRCRKKKTLSICAGNRNLWGSEKALRSDRFRNNASLDVLVQNYITFRECNFCRCFFIIKDLSLNVSTTFSE